MSSLYLISRLLLCGRGYGCFGYLIGKSRCFVHARSSHPCNNATYSGKLGIHTLAALEHPLSNSLSESELYLSLAGRTSRLVLPIKLSLALTTSLSPSIKNLLPLHVQPSRSFSS